MGDKKWSQLLKADREIRNLFPANPQTAPGTEETVLATIEVIGAFEMFNTRSYHNYESWGQGYRVKAQGIEATSEDLDDALALWKSISEKAEVDDIGK